MAALATAAAAAEAGAEVEELVVRARLEESLPQELARY
jgi:hypothetical protein